MNASLAHALERAALCLPSGPACAEQAPWNPHPAFPGVALKLLCAGAHTGGALSCHLVRVDPGCALAEHAHPGRLELHQALAGSGRAEIAGQAAQYVPGTLAVIPADAPHAVRAGEQGLLLLALFSPALL
jgi:quercetin dioxygenase-like cupin family protein